MKAVLISIQPKYCRLIIDGEKTIEVRKSYPKQLKTPFKCYIYCTKGKVYETVYRCRLDENRLAIPEAFNGRVWGEFVCDKISRYDEQVIEGGVFYSDSEYAINESLCEETQLDNFELLKYGKGRTLYGWRISELKIYDKPKELSEFKVTCQLAYSCINKGIACDDKRSQTYTGDINGYCAKRLSRPPQSWCYAEVEE